jgi:hypothetical protein
MKINYEASQYAISPASCYSPSAHALRDYKTARSFYIYHTYRSRQQTVL